jgi:hypothetical protein
MDKVAGKVTTRNWASRHRSLKRLSTAREWLDSQRSLFPTQARAGRPCTHTLLCGGVAVLTDDYSYKTLYEKVAIDATAKNGGKVSICENFPRIYGRWHGRSADGKRRYPPDELAARAVALLGVQPDKMPQLLLDACQRYQRSSKRPVSRVKWTECTFALDFDYGSLLAAGYSINEIIADMRVVQRVMIECGAKPIATRTFVCVADAIGTLGVHAYFPFSAYNPEECMHLATIVLCRLQEERPLHLGNGRFWHQIVDVGIYDKSLRMIGVGKAKSCDVCENKLSSNQCESCDDRGIIFKDRRYYLRFYLDENGCIDHSNNSDLRWIQPLNEFIRRQTDNPPPPPPAAPSLTLSSSSLTNEFRPVVAKSSSSSSSNGGGGGGGDDRPVEISTHKRAAEFVTALLMMCSIRLVMSREHTRFTPPPDCPRPNYPRAWIEFFQSVLDTYQPDPPRSSSSSSHSSHHPTPQLLARRALYVDGRGDDENDEEDSCRPLPVTEDQPEEDGVPKKAAVAAAAVVVPESVTLTPWSSPAGEAMSMISFNLNHGGGGEGIDGTKVRHHDRVLRERLDHLLISPHDNVEDARRMATGAFSEFKHAETVFNDPEGRCRLLQDYLRGWTHTAYTKLQVVRINHSTNYGNTLVHVRGPGQHFCQIAGRYHRKNVIFFLVRRRTGELTQHCFHKECVGRHFSFGAIGHDDVRVLFSPLEFLQKKKDNMTAEQRGWAEKLCNTSPALATKLTRSKIRRKSSVQSTSVPPSTTHSGPLMSPAYSYANVALGDDHEEEADAVSPASAPFASSSYARVTTASKGHQIDKRRPGEDDVNGTAAPRPQIQGHESKKPHKAPIVMNDDQLRQMRDNIRRRPPISLPPRPLPCAPHNTQHNAQQVPRPPLPVTLSPFPLFDAAQAATATSSAGEFARPAPKPALIAKRTRTTAGDDVVAPIAKRLRTVPFAMSDLVAPRRAAASRAQDLIATVNFR